MRTKSLFHFTKRLDVLHSILKNGFWPRYCFEDISWVSAADFYGTPMVCFCDISISKLEIHTEFYGNFGIGMSREWGIASGLNPLLYVSSESIVSEVIKGLFENPDPAYSHGKFDVMATLVHTKPLFGKMNVGGNIIEKNFYEECEWRFVELSQSGIFPSEAPDRDALEEFNLKTRASPLKFDIADIKYLLVESESDVSILVDYINTELSHYSKAQLQLLTTKILVLKSLREDL